jgi:protein TonB
MKNNPLGNLADLRSKTSALCPLLTALLIHFLILFAWDFGTAAAPASAMKMRIVQLTNDNEAGGASPAARTPPAQTPRQAASPAVPKAPVGAAAQMPVTVTEERAAEQFAEREAASDFTAETGPASDAEAEQTTWSESAAAGSTATGTYRPSDSEGQGKSAQGTAAYVKKNFDYIQRRIRDRLVYPAGARRMGVQGKTEVIFTIHENGTVSAVTVRLSSGNELLDKAAVDAVYAAAPFRPPPPSQARLVVPVVFSLR